MESIQRKATEGIIESKMCSLCNWLLGFCGFPKIFLTGVQNYPVLWENRYLDSHVGLEFLSVKVTEFQFLK